MVYSVCTLSSYQKRIHINSSFDGVLTDFQIKLTISHESAMKSDFGDLRFYETNDDEISYWIESYTASTTAAVWIKTDVPASGGKDLYMHYGDSGLSSESSIDDTFLFGDDFPGSSLDTTKWLSDASSGCSVSVTGGELLLNAPIAADDNTHAFIYTNSFTFTQAIIEIREKCNATYYMHSSVGSGSTCLTGSNKYMASGYYFMKYMPTSMRMRRADAVCGVVDIGTNFDMGTWTSYETHKHIICNDASNNIRWYISNVLENQATDTTHLSNDKKISLSQSEYGGRGGIHYVDWIFVRKYTANEPTTSTYSEETVYSTEEFTRRKLIYVNSSSDGALTDYQVKLTISYESAMDSDFDDLRFYETNDDEIPYWIESYTASSTATIWIKTDVPASDGKDLWLYYGNPGFESDANGSNTFIQIKEGNDLFNTSGRCSPIGGIVYFE